MSQEKSNLFRGLRWALVKTFTLVMCLVVEPLWCYWLQVVFSLFGWSREWFSLIRLLLIHRFVNYLLSDYLYYCYGWILGNSAAKHDFMRRMPEKFWCRAGKQDLLLISWWRYSLSWKMWLYSSNGQGNRCWWMELIY